MARQTGVNVNKLEGGLGRQNDSTDNHFAIIGSIPPALLSLLPSVEENKAIELNELGDLEAKGFNEAFDANNKLLVHYHVSEYFRLAPDARLYFIPTITQTITEVIPQIIPTIRDNSTIKGIGFIGFTDKLSGLNIDALQASLVDAFTKENRDIDCVLLEALPDGEAFSINDLPDLREKKGANISVIIGQDPAIAALDTEYKHHACIGSALGMLAVRSISENLGSVNIEIKPRDKRSWSDYPLTDTSSDRWLDAALSDGTPIGEISKTNLKTLTTNKGYILAAGYEGYAGIFFTGSTTAIEKASDYSTIENNRVWNAGKRAIRAALIPYVKGKVKKDPQTGFIAATTVAQWQGACNKALDEMNTAGHISGYDVNINREQVVNSDSPVKVRVLLVANGIVHEFDVDLGLTNNI